MQVEFTAQKLAPKRGSRAVLVKLDLFRVVLGVRANRIPLQQHRAMRFSKVSIINACKLCAYIPSFRAPWAAGTRRATPYHRAYRVGTDETQHS